MIFFLSYSDNQVSAQHKETDNKNDGGIINDYYKNSYGAKSEKERELERGQKGMTKEGKRIRK